MVANPSPSWRAASSVSTHSDGIGSPVSWCRANARRIDGSHAHISLTCDGYSTKSRGTAVPDCDGHRTAESRPWMA